MPHLFAGRRGYTLSVEPRLDGLCAAPIGGEPEYPLHHTPLWLVDHERVTRLVVPKAVWWLPRGDDFALAGFLEFPSAAPLSELCPLVLSLTVALRCWTAMDALSSCVAVLHGYIREEIDHGRVSPSFSLGHPTRRASRSDSPAVCPTGTPSEGTGLL